MAQFASRLGLTLELEPVTLENGHVRLAPFDVGAHGASLRAMAEELGDTIATWPYYNPPHDWIGFWLQNIQARIDAGTLIPFAVTAPDGRFAGLTSYLGADQLSRHVEIGMTIYGKDFQGTAINPACKLLLLGHAFDRGAIRVQLNVDERNTRSQAAVLKLGAKQEGILRNDRILPSGFVRSTVVFSILKSEWPVVKARLDARLATFRDA